MQLAVTAPEGVSDAIPSRINISFSKEKRRNINFQFF